MADWTNDELRKQRDDARRRLATADEERRVTYDLLILAQWRLAALRGWIVSTHGSAMYDAILRESEKEAAKREARAAIGRVSKK